MAFGAIGDLHAGRVAVVAVEAVLELAFAQAVGIMTGIAILDRVSAGARGHLLALFRVAGDAGRFDITQGGKVDLQRMVRVVTAGAVVEAVVGAFVGSVAQGAFGNNPAAEGGVLKVAILAAHLAVGFAVGGDILHGIDMTLNAIGVAENIGCRGATDQHQAGKDSQT